MNPISAMRSLVNSMHMVHVVNVGVQLGLFRTLADCQQPVGMQEYIRQTSYGRDHVEAWLRAAHATGIVDIDDGDRVAFREGWQEALTDRDSDAYIPPMVDCHFSIAGFYPRFPALFRTGGVMPLTEFDRRSLALISEDGIRFANFFIRKAVKEIPDLEGKLDAGITVYDVGCGCGQFLLKIAEKYPRSRFVGIDHVPQAIGYAKEQMAKRRMGDRVEFVQMCATSLTARDADFVILNEVLHEMEEDKRFDALRAIRASLASGGKLFLVDILAPERPVDYGRPEYQLSALVKFFETPWGSRLLTRSELEGLVSRAGFGGLKHIISADNVIAAYTEPS